MSNSSPNSASRLPLVSVVIPVYQNAETLVELHGRLIHVFETLPYVLEIIFVDDCCPQDSLAVIRRIAGTDGRVKALALASNLGQHRAIMLGLRYAQGQIITIMDADLQDPPEAIPGLLNLLSQGYEAVFAGQAGRYQSQFRLLSSHIFKWLIHLIANVPADAGIYVALSRKMVDALLAMKELRPYIVGMIGCTSLNIASVPVLRSEPPSGQSAYTFWDRLRMGIDAIFRISLLKIRRRRPLTAGWPYQVSIKAAIGLDIPGSGV